MRAIATATIAAIGISILAACEPQDQQTSAAANDSAEAQREFNDADRNQDGVLSRDEATSIADLNFTSADTDGNQTLSINEYEVAAGETTPRG